MRVLIDTNVLLDVLCEREGFAEAALHIFRLCEVNRLEGIVSALSVPNIVYIMRKELNAERVAAIIERLSLIFSIADLTAADLTQASKLGFHDFEDALQAVCAKRVKAERIITRNTRDFKASPIPAMTPTEFIWQNPIA